MKIHHHQLSNFQLFILWKMRQLDSRNATAESFAYLLMTNFELDRYIHLTLEDMEDTTLSKNVHDKKRQLLVRRIFPEAVKLLVENYLLIVESTDGVTFYKLGRSLDTEEFYL